MISSFQLFLVTYVLSPAYLLGQPIIQVRSPLPSTSRWILYQGWNGSLIPSRKHRRYLGRKSRGAEEPALLVFLPPRPGVKLWQFPQQYFKPIFSLRDGGAPQGHRGFLQPRLRDQAPSKVSYLFSFSTSSEPPLSLPEPGLCVVRLVSIWLGPWSHCGRTLWRAFPGGETTIFREISNISPLLKAGGVRCWSAERLVSPLLLASCFPEYREWCQVHTTYNFLLPSYIGVSSKLAMTNKNLS